MHETLVELLVLLGPRAEGTHFCNVGSAMHSLTGYDSDFSLFGIGKKTVFNVVMQKGYLDHFMAQRRMLTPTSTVYD